MKHYLETPEKVFEEIKSSQEGLSSQEAELRLERDGKNKLAEGKKTSLFMRFMKQLADPMIIILLAAAAVSFLITFFEETNEGLTDVIIILIVVLLNAILGVVQESKAEQAIAALQEMTASTCKVLRDGKQVVIKSQDLAIGDVVILEAGDSVPADARIIECASMKVEEAALTGESVPSEKEDGVLSLGDRQDVPLGDRKNMVYMGSTVVYGRGKAVVVAIGMQTEMGKIADVLAQAEEEQTPLQKKLAGLSKVLTYAVLGICAFIFAFKLIGANWAEHIWETILDSFIIAVSLAVAAIPEGLATVVTIVLSIGVTNMSKKNAVIRKLTAVEALGCAQIICSDKTGTLTQNKMTVVEYYGADEKLLATAMAQCSDATLDGESAIGEPTECALVNYAYKLGINKNELSSVNPRVGEAPFDSMRKMMSTVHQTAQGIIQYTKGAPDEILKNCAYALIDGKEVELNEEIKKTILAENKRMADKALRVLAGAYKKHDAIPSDTSPEALENNLVFIGLTGMIDPVRPEVLDAIKKCRDAGIKPIMITGDHIDTAIAIALELGIITDKSQAITGAMLNDISDEDFEREIENYSVYARVQPEHKVRIVTTWKKKGCITAMTGDGVNDAPSIKSADIGVGMGITGTDVTKNTADMVLADDNFATIVSAVGEGRKIYDNIRKAIQFLLSSNLSEVIGIFVATVLGVTLLEPVHLLWINLITDTFPALALGMEESEDDVMKRPPRDSKDGIFAGGMAFNVVTQGLFVAVLTLLAYFVGHAFEVGYFEIPLDGISHDGTTMAFLTMSMAEMFHAFNVRSQRHSLFTLKKQNLWMWGAFVLSLILTTLVIYVPFLRDAFHFTAISPTEYFIAMAMALTVIPFVELTKLIKRLIDKKKSK
ncbi:MAG: calcium-translocating P-type ATPase, PMCA-type [Clostridia bacterium]|nr:calcium-translocating P-type ATPase, PMCA-type [Clostridia bacterium]